MIYTASITFEDRVEAQSVVTTSELRALGLLMAGVYLYFAYVVGSAIAVAATQAWLTIAEGRLGHAQQMLENAGYGWLLWLGAALVPVAIVFIAWCLRSAMMQALPLSWQIGAHSRLRRGGYLGEHRYSFTAQALECKDAKTTEAIAWSRAVVVRETARCLCLLLKGGGYVIIPKSGCRAPDEIDALRSALQSHVGR